MQWVQLHSKRVNKEELDVEVKNFAIEKVPAEVDVVVTHKELLERAKRALPGKRIVTIESFLKDPKYRCFI